MKVPSSLRPRGAPAGSRAVLYRALRDSPRSHLRRGPRSGGGGDSGPASTPGILRIPGAATTVLGRWKQEPYPVVRDPRSRELLDSLTPALLTAMLGTVEPDLALERFDHLLSCLPDGRQMFSLFQANLHVMEHVAEMMVCAPAIAERVAERPAPLPGAARKRSRWRRSGPHRARRRSRPAPGILRRKTKTCCLACAGGWRRPSFGFSPTLCSAASTPSTSRRCATPRSTARSGYCWRAASTRQARVTAAPAPPDCALLVTDRPGARNASIVSDRNLVLIHDSPEDAESDGETPLATSTYYEALLRRLVELGGGEGGRETASSGIRLQVRRDRRRAVGEQPRGIRAVLE